MIAAIAILAASFGEPEAAKADENLARMKAIASSCRFALDGDRAGPLAVGAEPVFRMGKQAAYAMIDGAVFLWANEAGRPEAASQVYRVRDRSEAGSHWVQEFVSLSTGTIVADRGGRPVWAPRAPGVAFKPIPGAPKPAETPGLRTRQVKAMAQDFKVSDDFKAMGWSELRLLPTPLARYGKGGPGVLDGAVVGFAQGTDLEAFVILEAREGPEGPAWHYAFAPMTAFALKGSHKGEPVWDAPRRGVGGPSKPFFYLAMPPEPAKAPEEPPR